MASIYETSRRQKAKSAFLGTNEYVYSFGIITG